MALPDPAYYYGTLLAWDPATRAPVAGAGFQFFAEGDAAYANPLQVWDFAGVSLGTTVTSTPTGHVVGRVLAVERAVAKSGTYTELVVSSRGAQEAAEAARDAALAAQAAAEAVESSASGISGAPAAWPSTFPPSAHSHETTDLRRGGAALASLILSFLAASDQQAARAAIGAGTGSGTSNLTLGTTSTTAAPGDHLHPQYQTEQGVLDLIAANGGGGGTGNIVAVKYASGAYPALAASYPNGTFLWALGPTPPTWTDPPGVVMTLYGAMDLA